MKPAARRRRTTLWSWPGAQSPMKSAPKVRRWPATGTLFLIAIGTPANGRSSPARTSAAAARASSAKTSTNASSSGSSAAMRSSEAWTSSVAPSSPERTRPPSSVAGRKRRSDMARETSAGGQVGGYRAARTRLTSARPAHPPHLVASRVPGRCGSAAVHRLWRSQRTSLWEPSPCVLGGGAMPGTSRSMAADARPSTPVVGGERAGVWWPAPPVIAVAGPDRLTAAPGARTSSGAVLS